jgi:hypothetical protein
VAGSVCLWNATFFKATKPLSAYAEEADRMGCIQA